IRRLLEKILDNDRLEAPFKIVDVEKELNVKIPIKVNGDKHETPLLGKLDRIENKNGATRIIDYKTGRFKLQNQGKKSDEKYLDNLINNIFNSEIPFSQTEDIDRCKWCPFKGICYRE